MRAWGLALMLGCLTGCAAFQARDGQPAPVLTVMSRVLDGVDAVADSPVADGLATAAGPFGLIALVLYRSLRRKQRALDTIVEAVEDCPQVQPHVRQVAKQRGTDCDLLVHEEVSRAKRRIKARPAKGAGATTREAT